MRSVLGYSVFAIGLVFLIQAFFPGSLSPNFGVTAPVASLSPPLPDPAQTTTIAKNIQELFLAGRDWPYGAALGFVLMIVTLTGTLLALRTLRREVVGAD